MGSVVALKKYQGYQKKTIKFGGKTLELFSLDGATWSSRPAELAEIKARHEAQSVPFGAPLNKNASGHSKPMRKMAPHAGKGGEQKKVPRPMLTAAQASERFQNAKVEAKAQPKKQALPPAPKKRASVTPKKKKITKNAKKKRAA